MRFLFLMLLGLALVGCGTTGSVALTPEAQQEVALFSVLDERPESQKHSYNEENPNGKNQYFGDDNFKPSGPEMLKATLLKQFGNQLSGKAISLTDFVVSVYEPSVTVNSSAINNAAASVPNGYAAAPLAAVLIWAIEGAKSEKNVLVQVSGKIDNEPFNGSVYENYKGRVTESNIKDSVDKALEEAVSQIKSNMERHAQL
jgi:hypothetical protein